MTEHVLGEIDTYRDQRIVIVHGVSEGRGSTSLRLERCDHDGEWIPVRHIAVTNSGLWLLRDAIDRACDLAAREAR